MSAGFSHYSHQSLYSCFSFINMQEREQEFIDEDEERRVYVFHPAYIHMDLWKEEDGWHGAFSLDDRVGWSWYGDDDTFLLGLLRVYDTNKEVINEFEKEVEDEGVRKKEIKEAILNSLKQDPSDGLYHLLGDNSMYMGFGIIDEYAGFEHEMNACLREKLGDLEKAKQITFDIVDEAIDYEKSSEEVFEEIEKRLTKNSSDLTGKNVSWKEFVKETIDKCDAEHKDTTGFLECVADELLELKDDGIELFYVEYDANIREAIEKAVSKKKKMKEIAEKHNILFGDMEACIREVV